MRRRDCAAEGRSEGSESEDEKAEGVRRAEPWLKEAIGERLEPRHGVSGPPRRTWDPLDEGGCRGFRIKAVERVLFAVKCGEVGCW